ncbi:hypothetical protein NOCARDAX2BIS_170070 [Nocardioides sp. AX2bis]|nr:hypothetical protein NOCARDAX2BIS_170070 [Nocardioides sp. AX2bis]
MLRVQEALRQLPDPDAQGGHAARGLRREEAGPGQGRPRRPRHRAAGQEVEEGQGRLEVGEEGRQARRPPRTGRLTPPS